jgi:hypothetical protein
VDTRTAATKTVRFYVNGIGAGSRSYVNAATTSPVAVSIGRSTDGNQTVNGRLDEVALYMAALSPAQISAHYSLRTHEVDSASIGLQLAAFDPDGDALTYSATGLPPGLAVNATTGLISGTLIPSTNGTYHITATAYDDSASTSQTFTWTIAQADGGA